MCAEGPRPHHGEAGENAVRRREAVCGSDCCRPLSVVVLLRHVAVLISLCVARLWGVIRASIPIIAEVSICRGKLCLPRQNNQAGASAAPITGPRRLPRKTSAKAFVPVFQIAAAAALA